MSGILMQCFRPHYTYFENQIAGEPRPVDDHLEEFPGCVVGKIGMRINDFAVVNDEFVKCAEVAYGELDVTRVTKHGRSTHKPVYIFHICL
jgi:hypothetical protein